MFAALSDPLSKNRVSPLVSKFIALAPVVYMSNHRSTPIQAAIQLSSAIVFFSRALGLNSILNGDCSQNAMQARF